MGVWVYVSSGGVRGGVSAKMCERVHAAGALDGEIPEDDGQEEDGGDEEDAIVRALRQRMQQVCTEREGDGEEGRDACAREGLGDFGAGGREAGSLSQG